MPTLNEVAVVSRALPHLHDTAGAVKVSQEAASAHAAISKIPLIVVITQQLPPPAPVVPAYPEKPLQPIAPSVPDAAYDEHVRRYNEAIGQYQKDLSDYNSAVVALAAYDPRTVIEVSLEHVQGQFVKLTGRDSSGEEGAVAMTNKILLEFSRPDFDKWLASK